MLESSITAARRLARALLATITYIPFGRRWRSSVVAFAFGLVHVTAGAQELPLGADLEGLLRFARESSAEYASARAEANAAAARVVPAGALPDPRVRIDLQDITRGGARFPTVVPWAAGRTTYLLTQELPWFGKRQLRTQAAEWSAEVARWRAAASWTDLAALIRKAYIRYYFLSRNETLTQEILELARRLEAIAQTRYANGLAAQQDAIRAQVEQTAVRSDLIELENQRRATIAAINALLNRPVEAALAEPRTLPSLPEPEALTRRPLLERLLESNPQVQAETRRIDAAASERDLAFRERYPDFTVGVAPVQIGPSVREWMLMLELNIPLQQAARRGREREATEMLSAARARRSAVGQRLAGELGESLSAYAAAARTERLIATSLLPQSRLTLDAALAGYETGKVDFATLLDAQRQINQARLNQLRAQAAQHASLADIERLLGEAP